MTMADLLRSKWEGFERSLAEELSRQMWGDRLPRARWKYRHRLYRILRGELHRERFRDFLAAQGPAMAENINRPVPYLEWLRGR